MATAAVETLFTRGKALIEGKNFEQALRFFGDLAEKLPYNPIPRYYLGLAALGLGRTDAALANFACGEELTGRYAFTRGERQEWEDHFTYARANLHVRKNDYKKAYEILEKLIRERLLE
jgi:tetratricopeptide (TPR) repeat protein